MTSRAVRCIAGLAVATCGLLSLAAPGGATPAPPATITQTFTGGAIGTITQLLDGQLPFDGKYSSTGQLGFGHVVTVDRFLSTTAVQFTRSDGMTLTGTAHQRNECGLPLPFPPAVCWSMDLSGTGDIVKAHVVIQVTLPKFHGSQGGIGSFSMHGTLTLKRRIGYVLLDREGQPHAFGGIDHLGRASPFVPAADLALTPSGNGYWIVEQRGGVSNFGDAPVVGEPQPPLSATEAVASMSATPSGHGVWLFTTRGRVIPIGDARWFGDLASTRLNGHIVDSIATPTGKGYYMVASDGGVFAFGDARFRGSMGGRHLNGPVVGIVAAPNASGYWLVASDGGVFSFNATFYGSMGATPLNRPIAAMVAYGHRYLMIGSDGGVFNFSQVPYFGNAISTGPSDPVVSGAAIG
jgi:hypothetical protein